MEKVKDEVPETTNESVQGYYNKDLTRVFQCFTRMKDVVGKAAFSMWVSKNMRFLQDEYKMVMEVIKEKKPVGEDIDKFTTIYDGIIQGFARRDENGQLIQDGPNYIIPDERRDDYDKALADAKSKFPEATKDLDEYEKFVEDVMNQPVTRKFLTIKNKDLPELAPVQRFDVENLIED